MDDDVIRALMSGVPIPLVLVNDAEQIAQINPQAETLFGRVVPGRHYLTVLRQPALAEAIADVVRTGQPHDARFTHRDHSQETIYRVSCTPIDGAGVLASFEDVTTVETAGQMRRDFVANVSHELRTPLTALMGFIETLRGPAKNDAAVRDRFLATMEQEAGRMNRLVRDLLSLSRVETAERVRPTEMLDLPDLVASVCRSLRPLADDAGVAFEIGGSDDVPLVVADADQLRQVFTNLIENAIKYGGQGERIAITYAVVARDVILGAPAIAVTVRDFGDGIDNVHLHRLTERFYRVDSHRSQALGGTGLGLAIVKHVLNRHRGRLSIDSAVGSGSAFTVVLPSPDRETWKKFGANSPLS